RRVEPVARADTRWRPDRLPVGRTHQGQPAVGTLADRRAAGGDTRPAAPHELCFLQRYRANSEPVTDCRQHPAPGRTKFHWLWSLFLLACILPAGPALAAEEF